MTASEEEIYRSAEQEMLRCRPGDWEHAKRVARWARTLGENRDDLRLLVTAGLIHDIGWRDIVPSSKKITFDKLLKYEPEANRNSHAFVTEFLSRFEFTHDEINKALRLVAAADNHKATQDDEAIIVDADNLSKLTIDHLKEKFEPTEWMKMHDLWVREYPSRIATSKGKALYKPLLNDLHQEIARALPNST